MTNEKTVLTVLTNESSVLRVLTNKRRVLPGDRGHGGEVRDKQGEHEGQGAGGEDRGHSAAARSRSFNTGPESVNISGLSDFKNLGISKNFSSDVIREVYGSKTSLLKHLDHQREERRLRQLEDGGRALVAVHLSRSTDSVLSRPEDSLEEVRQTGEQSHCTSHFTPSHLSSRYKVTFRCAQPQLLARQGQQHRVAGLANYL